MGLFQAELPGASVPSIATGCFMNCGHHRRRRFPISLWSKRVPIDTGPVLSGYWALSAYNSSKCTPLNLVGGLGLKWYASREGEALGCCERGIERSYLIKKMDFPGLDEELSASQVGLCSLEVVIKERRTNPL